MTKYWGTTILCGFALFIAGCGGGMHLVSTPTPTPIPQACVTPATEFVYALTDGPQSTTVSMYTTDSCTGMFKANTPATVPTGQLPIGSEIMTVDPLGRFVYVANLNSNATSESTISMYTINAATGVLTPTTPATVPTGFFPQGIAIDPAGKFVYTANSDDNTISMFTINPTTGVLTPTTPPTVTTPLGPRQINVDPSGKFAYSANDTDEISAFTIDSTTGVLSPMTLPTVFAGGSPFDIAVSPSGQFLYVVDNLLNRVVQFTINPATGALTANTPAAVATGNGPTAAIVDPSNKFAYVINRLDNTVSIYTIDPVTGNLTPKGTATTGVDPFRFAFDASGRFLYVVNEESAASVYTINSDGTLLSEGTTGANGGALSVAITPKH